MVRYSSNLGRVLLIAGLLVSEPNIAGQIVKSEVTHEEGVYHIVLDVWIEAPEPMVRELVTAYDYLGQVNPAVQESEIIHTFSPVHHRVRSVIRFCFAFFCKRMQQVQDVEQLKNGDIVATILPEGSDFRAGLARWRLYREREGTRMQVTARLEPDFWVPPVIGPWLIAYKLRGETLESAENLERLARP